MKILLDLFFRSAGILLILFAIALVSENGEHFLKANGLFMGNKEVRGTLQIDDRLPAQMEAKVNIAEDDSPLYGLLDIPSFMFVSLLSVGLVLVCLSFTDLVVIIKDVVFNSTPKILAEEKKVEISLRKASDGYYSKGGAGLKQSFVVKNLPVWPLIIKQLEIKMPIQDISMMMGNSASLVRKEFDRRIRLLSTIANFLPSLGVVGTVLGLIKLLYNLDDFSKIGPSMALALMTTFYGLLFSVIITKPMVVKLEQLKLAVMNLYQTASFWLVVIDSRKPSFYLEQDYSKKSIEANKK